MLVKNIYIFPTPLNQHCFFIVFGSFFLLIRSFTTGSGTFILLRWSMQSLLFPIDQLGDLAYFSTNFAPKIGHVFFWYSSARIWSIFKMDTPMDGSLLAVLPAYQNNLVTSKMIDSMVPDFNVRKIQLLTGKS